MESDDFSFSVQSDLFKHKTNRAKAPPVFQEDSGEFVSVKQRYNELRDEQRKIIIEYLEYKGFSIVGRNGGRGIKKYTSGGRLKRPYDLSNWKWIEATKNGNMALITLHAFDRDPNSLNCHVLVDRIGILFHSAIDASPKSWQEMEVTEIDLPMNEKKLNELADILRGGLGK